MREKYKTFIFITVCWLVVLCWRKCKLLVGPPMPDRSTGKGKKCSLWSSRLGVERADYDPYTRKFSAKTSRRRLWRRRPIQGCCPSKGGLDCSYIHSTADLSKLRKCISVFQIAHRNLLASHCITTNTLINTGCFKTSVTTSKVYRNLFKGKVQCFELP
jgi:hypothetical protein